MGLSLMAVATGGYSMGERALRTIRRIASRSGLATLMIAVPILKVREAKQT
jgi:hypothetical protein